MHAWTHGTLLYEQSEEEAEGEAEAEEAEGEAEEAEGEAEEEEEEEEEKEEAPCRGPGRGSWPQSGSSGMGNRRMHACTMAPRYREPRLNLEQYRVEVVPRFARRRVARHVCGMHGTA